MVYAYLGKQDFLGIEPDHTSYKANICPTHSIYFIGPLGFPFRPQA
jgi:hypothetical protein